MLIIARIAQGSAGALLVTAAIAALIYGLSNGSSTGSAPSRR